MNGGTWSGSPFSHPNSELLDVFLGLLSQQSMPLRDGIGALRMGLKHYDVGYAPIPHEINLVMNDGTHVHGRHVIEGTVIVPHSGNVHITMTYREDGCLHWIIVDIVHDRITATHYRNPVDEQLTEPAFSS